jgi:GTPase SAR1 family protein
VTVGVEFSSKTVEVNEKTSVMLQVWDTAGQETFKAIVRSFYKGIAAAFLVYSIDK